MTRVSLTPAPSEAGMPRSVWVTARGRLAGEACETGVCVFIRPEMWPGRDKTRGGSARAARRNGSPEHRPRGRDLRRARQEEPAGIGAAVRDLADEYPAVVAVEVDAYERERLRQSASDIQHHVECVGPRDARGVAWIDDREILLIPVRVEELSRVMGVAVEVELHELRYALPAKDLVILDIVAVEDQRLDDDLGPQQPVINLPAGVVIVECEPLLDALAVHRLAGPAQNDLRAGVRRLDAAA